MVKVLIGDVFESKAQVLVNTVNCVGIMGKGVALEFKKRYPEMYEDYIARCKAGQVRLGRPYLFRGLLTPPILNFPTKGHWRSVSKVADIIEGLRYLIEHYREWGITSIALPPLGCGQGGLEWRQMGPILYQHLAILDIPVELYAPYGTPQAELEPAFLNQTAIGESEGRRFPRSAKLNPAWVALVQIVARIEHEPYHWPIGRTTFQKIAFFATSLGLPTGLNYQKASYGPFATELKNVITRLVNEGVLQEKQVGRMFAVKPGPAYADTAKVYADRLVEWNLIIEKVTDLFLRMPTHRAEVAATVYFVAKSLSRDGEHQPSEKDVMEQVKQWKQKRRPPLEDDEVGQTIRNLNLLRWFDLQVSPDLPLQEGQSIYA
jgi:O-acetyl-ADP-ribose deacetylase (regulator of RNase III)/uncharacterized protein YwgA